MNFSDECKENLKSFAYSCIGYVGADIEMLCNTAILESIENNCI